MRLFLFKQRNRNSLDVCFSIHLWFLPLLWLLLSGLGASGQQSTSPEVPTTSSTARVSSLRTTTNQEQQQQQYLPPKMGGKEEHEETTNEILVVFSDVDGTLVHYPTDKKQDNDDNDNTLLRLPPSMTGLQGVISSQTLRLCQSLRRHTGSSGGVNTKLVLVSGMRTHTLLKRLPFLPKADAYCSEAGGRIFYPLSVASAAEEEGKTETNYHAFTPQPYTGASEPKDLTPFGLVEDVEWRARMEQSTAAGPEGYSGNEIESFFEIPKENESVVVPVEERTGELWKFARFLQSRGLVLDTKGYSSCFRVNEKHQTTNLQKQTFADLLKGDIPHPPLLATSTNLGCIDFYPAHSGKKNCCQYLLGVFSKTSSTKATATLKRNAVCLCDDDNDLEMAMGCRHAYLPAISSQSMSKVVEEHAGQFTLAENRDEGVVETLATERALELVIERVVSCRV